MRRRLLLAGLWGVPGGVRAEGRLEVVASFTILADFVRRIGGEDVAVVSLVGADGDAHTYQPRPSDVRALQGAGVVVENGLMLEPWLDRLVGSAGVLGRVVVASAGIGTRRLLEGSRTVVDPHVWQDPRNAVGMVGTIAAALAEADGGRAEAYRRRAGAFVAEILQADAEIGRSIGAIDPAKRRIITSHDAFGYYGARYGVEFRAVQGINTDAEPTPRELARLAAQVRREGIRAVFVENMTDPRLAAALAREAGAIVGAKVYSDSLSAADGPAASYLAMLRYNTAQFVGAMAAQ